MNAGHLKHHLTDDGIQLWWGDVNDARLHAWRSPVYLSESESERANRFYFEKDRVLYILAHNLLRCILSHYLSILPSDISFDHNSYGKPSIATCDSSIEFNLSHSGQQVLVAVSKKRSVGIDIESLDRRIQALELARGHFSFSELEQLKWVDPKQLISAFHQTWVAKEAYIKAMGVGLSFSLKDFSVPQLDTPTGVWSVVKENSNKICRLNDPPCYIQWIEAPSGYRAAVCQRSNLNPPPETKKMDSSRLA